MNLRRIIIIFSLMLLMRIPARSSPDNYIDYDSGDWKTLNTYHFEIEYPEGLEGLALRAAELAERGYVRVSNYLGHEMTKITRIIVYPSNHGLQRHDFIDTATGDAKNRIVVPFHGSYAELQRSMTHEIVLAFQHDILAEAGPGMPKISAIRIPLWFAEGMAEYIACGYDDWEDMALWEIIRRNRHAGIRDLSNMRRVNIAQYRREGQAFFYFIEKRYGRTYIGEMLRDFRDIGYLDEVIHAGTGKTVEDLDSEWSAFLSRRYNAFKKKRHDDNKSIRMIAGERSPAMYMIPAVSHDGATIACLATMDKYPELVIFTTDKKTGKKKGSTIIRTTRCGRFDSVHAVDNNLSWTRDNKSIVMAARSNGRECIYFIDADNGRTLCAITLPFSAVMYPSVSDNGRYVAFTGIAGSSEDIYIYDKDAKKIIRVTDDDFSDRYPVLAPDGRSVIYSSNWNEDGDVARDEYNIYRKDLQTGKRTALVTGRGSNIQADISFDGRRMLYVSDRSGLYNAYVYDFITKKNEQITDTMTGVFHPRWFPDGRTFACVTYHDTGYALCVKDSAAQDFQKENIHIFDNIKIAYHVPYVNPSGYFFSSYNAVIKPEWFQLGSAGTFNNGYLCFIQIGMSDYLEKHRIVLTSNYVSLHELKSNDVNVDLAYYYHERWWNFALGIFRQASPLYVSSVGEINDFSREPDFGLISMEHYGGYAFSRYHFNSLFNITLKAVFGRYEKLYPDSERRKDLRATAGKISLLLEYDDVLRGAMVPVNGLSGRLKAEQCFDFTGRNSFSSVNIDLQRYILLGKQCMIVLRGAGGTVIGKNRGHFDYYLGGYNTLRGYDMLSLSGRNMFLLNAEFRFTSIDWMSYGLPLFSGLGNLAGALFIDAGSAWDGRFSMVNKKTGRFDDFKMDFGIGIRVAIYPLLIFKLDFAWPFDKKSIKQNDILFSAGFEY